MKKAIKDASDPKLITVTEVEFDIPEKKGVFILDEVRNQYIEWIKINARSCDDVPNILLLPIQRVPAFWAAVFKYAFVTVREIREPGAEYCGMKVLEVLNIPDAYIKVGRV